LSSCEKNKKLQKKPQHTLSNTQRWPANRTHQQQLGASSKAGRDKIALEQNEPKTTGIHLPWICEGEKEQKIRENGISLHEQDTRGNQRHLHTYIPHPANQTIYAFMAQHGDGAHIRLHIRHAHTKHKKTNTMESIKPRVLPSLRGS
jgi:hypothetical protein